jgi:peptidoglycan/LPS O-acetylase OafA/YrhL
LAVSYGRGQLDWQGWGRDFHQVSGGFLYLLPLMFGQGGVAIFFVVSGFCIHLSHERSKNKSFNVFFARRFFRIYPPYFVALIFFVLFLRSTKLNFHSGHDLAQFFIHLLLVHNLGGFSFSGISPSFWSIAVEAQLYLLYPLLLLLVGRWGWKGALLVTGVIEVFLRLTGGLDDNLPRWFTSSPLTYWFSWSIGACLADGLLKGRRVMLTGCPLWVWPVFTVVFFFIKPLYGLCFLTIALFTANVIAYLARTENAGQANESRIFGWGYLARHIRWVGVISYSVYLLHQPFTWFMPHIFSRLFPAHPVHPLVMLASFGLEWPLILLMSYFFYRYVEQPSIHWGKWFIRTKLVGDAVKQESGSKSALAP